MFTRPKRTSLVLQSLLSFCIIVGSGATKDGALQTSVPVSSVHGPTSQQKLKDTIEAHKNVGVALAAVKGSHEVFDTRML
mmetsp:Transcript_50652/g.101138  ORF Transcript_50652/g.101138 Transcript_50652/m.101138 type:complete len:80 (+) Transcript_50652:73-312(+)